WRRTVKRRCQARHRARGVARLRREPRARDEPYPSRGEDPMTLMPISRISVARITSHTAVYVSVLALAGCASMAGVGGSAEFACKAPVGVKCDSVSGTYYNSLQQNLPSQQKSPPPEASTAPTLLDRFVAKSAAPSAYSTKGPL